MRKVTTPSRKEVQATTVVVIITVSLFGAVLLGVDTIIGIVSPTVHEPESLKRKFVRNI